MALPLLLFFSLFFAAAFFWPTWRLWKREGVNALVLPYDDTAYGLVGKWFRGALITIFALLAALTLGLSEAVLGPLSWLDGAAVRAVGWTLLAVSIAWS